MTFLKDDAGKLRLVWRLPLFIVLLAILLSPLFWVSPQWLQLLCLVILLTIFLKFWAAKMERKTLADYGLVPSISFGAEFLFGLIVGAFVIGLIFAGSVSWGAKSSITVNSSAIDGAFWLFLFRMLLVGYWEELLFRGFLYTSFRESFALKMGDRNSVTLALLLSSLLFGLVHIGTSNFSWIAFVILTINGMVWCLPMALTSRLGMSIGLHVSWNFSQSKIFGFSMSGNESKFSIFNANVDAPDYWTGGAYGPEAGVSGLVALAIMTLSILLYQYIVRGRSMRLSD